jgi:streptogramin lyase
MSDLTDRLERELAFIAPAADSLAHTYKRVARRRRTRRLAAAAVGLSVTGALVVGLSTTFPIGRPDKAGQFSGRQSIYLAGRPIGAAYGSNSLWVLTRTQGSTEGVLTRIDPASGRVLSSLTVKHPSGLAADDQAAWVISFWDNTATKVDPVSGQVIATIVLSLPPGGPADGQFHPLDVSVGEGGVWVTSAHGQVARIDPATDEVISMIAVPLESTGQVSAGLGEVWVTENLLGVFEIDPASEQIIAQIPIVNGADRLTVSDVQAIGGSVWAMGQWASPYTDAAGNPDYQLTGQNAVVQIDPATQQVLSKSNVPRGSYLMSGGGRIWLASPNGQLTTLGMPGGGQLDQGTRTPAQGRVLAVTPTALWTMEGKNLVRVTLARR